MIGGNFRLHELQAAFLRVKLKHLNPALEKRRLNAKNLIKVLHEKWGAIMPLDSCVCQGQGTPKKANPGTISLPFSCHSGEGEHTWNQFVIRVAGKGKRDALREKLAAKGVQTEIYYPRAMHEQDCFKAASQLFSTAQKLTIETLALPLSDDNWIPELS
jgi:dTDP-4-amino-4,6-dideoxygalactose transaminase